MMKKFVRCALLFCFLILICVACAKSEPDELLQTEHIPGKEEAAVHTATPTPVVTKGASPTELTSPTATQAPEPTEEVKVTPSPVPATPTPVPVEEPEFMEMYRAMPAGIRVNTEGISQEELRFCFCSMELTNQTRTALSGQEGLSWTDIRELDCVRVLYYRNDGKPYICDVIADGSECEAIINTFYQMYQKELKVEDIMRSLPDELSSRGYHAGTLSAGSAEYLYLFK